MTKTTGDPLTFERTVPDYVDGRPGYPARVYEFLSEIAAVGPAARVLEIGPGTGIATQELLERGAHVVALEIGEEMARTLGQRFDRQPLEVRVGDAARPTGLERDHYDAVVAGTSLHWIDAKGLPTLVASLKPGGWMCAWWTVYHDPEVNSEFQAGVHDLYRELLPAHAVDLHTGSRPLQVSDRVREFANAGLRDVRWEWVRWSTQLSGRQLRSLYATFPAIENRPANVREHVLDEIVALAGGTDAVVPVHYVTAIYAGRR